MKDKNKTAGETLNDMELLEKGITEGIISAEEGDPLREAYAAMFKAIAVDDF